MAYSTYRPFNETNKCAHEIKFDIKDLKHYQFIDIYLLEYIRNVQKLAYMQLMQSFSFTQVTVSYNYNFEN